MSIQLFNVPQAPVHSPVYILHGSSKLSQSIRVTSNAFPDQYFDINNGYFKSILSLQPGINEINVMNPQDCLKLRIEYAPLLQNPPVHLCLMVAKDSPMTFDSPLARLRQEGNDINVLIKKLRVAGRMMQMFTQQEMFRNGFGNRVFRFVEEMTESTVKGDNVKRSEIKIHVIRSDRTLKQLRDPNMAQQNSKGTNTGGLFDIALDELRKKIPEFHPSKTNLQPLQLAVMYLDAHWDTNLKLILTHAALGGGTGDIKLAIFGSHGMWSWPKYIDEISPCLSDEYRPSIKEVANDCNECSTLWECLNVTMGSFMHEIGHLLGCPHEENGIMLRDCVRFNRTFMTRESHCVRTGKGAWSPVLSKDECHWHRLDLVRFLYHPSFALPQDFDDLDFKPPVLRDLKKLKNTPIKPVVFPLPHNSAMVESTTGVYLIYCEVGEWSRFHLEYLPRSAGGPGPQKKILLNYDEIQQHLPSKYQNQRLNLQILSNGGEQTTINDFKKFLSQNNSFILQLVNGNKLTCFKSSLMGRPDGREMPMAVIKGFQITKVRIHSGIALDGVEFFGVDESQPPPIPPRNYSLNSALQKMNISTNNQREQFIARVGNVTNHYHDFTLNQGEYITSFNVRSGAWVDALQVVLNTGRTSPMYGGIGGGVSEMKLPDSFQIVALYGHLGQWINGIGIIYG